MSTIIEIIPAKVSPEIAFAVSLHDTGEKRERAAETLIPFRFVLPPEDEFARRGIPESALHD